MKAARAFRPAVSAGALLCGLAGAASAQVSAEDVWGEWRSDLALGEVAGVSVGSEEYADGVLTVTDIAIHAADAEGAVTGLIPEIVFTENGDGTVTVTASESWEMAVSIPADGEWPATDLSIRVSQPGLELLASGAPGAIAYDVAASRISVEIIGVDATAATPGQGQGPGQDPGEGTVFFALNGLAGSYGLADDGELQAIDFDLAAESVDMLIDFTDAATGDRLSLSGQAADVATAGSGLLPLAELGPDADPFAAGLVFEAGFSFGGADYIFEFQDDTGPTVGTVSFGGGETSFVASAEALGYDTLTTGVAFEATSPALPFPLAATIGEYGMTLLLPLQATAEPADWGFGLNLTDFALSDEIWAAIDGLLAQAVPGAEPLPRDPATVFLDLTGTATLFQPLTQPLPADGTQMAEPPGQIESVSINALDVSLLGASVTGSGSFTFDNADLSTIPGVPRPEGAADFTLTGIGALIDRLASLGILPQDQILAARMFLGLIGQPAGDDVLTSRVEATPDGQLIVNGQRIQ